MELTGNIVSYDGEVITLRVPFRDTEQMIKKGIHTAHVILDDGRTISADQRKKIYATFRDIAEYTGHMPEEVKALMKYDFIAATGCKYFSLSDVDMSTARDFLEYVIEFCLMWGIPTKDSLLERAPDVTRYIYWCVFHRRCAICGKKADIHEVDAVGMGNNRNEIHHLGQRVQPLCRGHHTEAHRIGQLSFNKKYHIDSIFLDEHLCKKIGWRK